MAEHTENSPLFEILRGSRRGLRFGIEGSTFRANKRLESFRCAVYASECRIQSLEVWFWDSGSKARFEDWGLESTLRDSGVAEGVRKKWQRVTTQPLQVRTSDMTSRLSLKIQVYK